ncbi:MAG: phenylacetate--CoA ligase [Caldilineales bacterium]|nr:phenylacetate--CoA ligase [Caldilineales bacterium]
MYQPDLETLPRPDLEALQLERLRHTLAHIAAGNPAYAGRFASLPTVQSLEQIRHLPFITKNDLRHAYPFQLACVPQTEMVRMQMSSGTTGTPIICPHTANDVRQWGEISARCLAAAGVGREDVIQITPSFGLFNGGFGFHYGASTLETMIIPIGAGRTGLQLQFLRDLNVTALAAVASYPLRLIEVAAEEGFDFHTQTRLRVGIFGAEVWSDELRRRVEMTMGIETFDIIGMTETGGVGMGIDCPAHSGIHVWEDHYLVEIIDPESEQPVADGEWGEMVVTTLTREALPLIRFRTRDITRILSREACACGRTGLRVDRIACRSDDMLKIKGINFYPKQVETILMEHEQVANDYQIHLQRVGGKDEVHILVESPLAAETASSRALASRLSDKLYDQLGLRARIELTPVGSIERPPGKAVRVIDRRHTA